MKKKLLAAAIGGLASVGAFAQSNVTVYGQFDLGIRHVTATGRDSVNQVGSMGSNLFGFKGTEELGNGLTAGFALEGSFSADTGAGTSVSTTGSKLFNRQSMLSLSSKTAGSLAIGRLNTFGRSANVRATAAPFTSMEAVNFIGPLAGFSVSGNGIDADQTGVRVNNGIAYTSPTFNGLTVGILHSFAENVGAQSATANNNPGYNFNELWAGYNNGPVNVDYVYNNIGAVAVNGTATGATSFLALGGLKEQFLGASYDFGTLKLIGSYQTRKTEITNADKLWYIGAAIPVNPVSTINVSYSKLSLGSDLKNRTVFSGSKNALAAGGIGYTGAPANLADASGWSASYIYALSKRTKAYTSYVHLKNDKDGTMGFGSGASSNPTAGGAANLFALGLQHVF